MGLMSVTVIIIFQYFSCCTHFVCTVTVIADISCCNFKSQLFTILLLFLYVIEFFLIKNESETKCDDIPWCMVAYSIITSSVDRKKGEHENKVDWNTSKTTIRI